MSEENINTHEEQGETQEHVDAMIAKGEELERNNNPNQEERPDWLPEKFKSVEDMASAYNNLEKKLGGKQEEATEEEVVENKEVPEEKVSETEASEVEQVLDKAGVDFKGLQNEFNEQGSLSEGAYEALQEAGFPQNLVDSWIQGQQALNNNYQNSVHEIVGGAEAYQEMIGWAGDNLSESEISAYDRAVSSGDIDMVKLAVAGLRTKYQTVEGADPSLLGGQSTSSSGGTYSSWAEVTNAMRDSRYESDPSYRQQVASKLERSDIQ